MRWPWKRRTDEELQQLAVEIYSAICAACASCPSSQRDAAAVAVTRDVVGRARLWRSEEARLVKAMGLLNEMLMMEALVKREAVGEA
ncbi:hypothetical protein [Methylobacterium radiotolerans]|uniref:hypothetical protein n=1 Tax=Methylobacterium radiotolerans TaxID=31998 RepID=UPI0015F561AB|nr:hypothetical protein [Methylobacterium radiotolerans]